MNNKIKHFFDNFITYTTPIVFAWYGIFRWIVFSHTGIVNTGDFLQWILPNVMTGVVLIYLFSTYIIYFKYDKQIMQSKEYIFMTIILFVYHLYCFADCIWYFDKVNHLKWTIYLFLDGFLLLYFTERMTGCFYLLKQKVKCYSIIYKTCYNFYKK